MCNKTQSQEVFKKYTGVFAISVNGVVNWDLYEKGGINTNRLIEFLQHNITSKLTSIMSIMRVDSCYYEVSTNLENVPNVMQDWDLRSRPVRKADLYVLLQS